MLQWADTFNRYGTNTALMLNGLPYAEVNATVTLTTDPDVSATGNVVKIAQQASSSTQLRTVFPGGAAATMGISQRLWMGRLPSAVGFGTGIEFRDIANANQFTVNIDTTGTISVHRGSASGTSIGVTTLPVISPNSWNHIEIKFTVSTTVGAVEIRVNGISVLNLTGVNNQNTGNTTVAQIDHISGSAVPSGSGNADMFLKDFIIWDTTGTYNKDFLGSVSVLDIDTDADTALTWTPSTGTNGWSILDNNPPLDDAAYISAATALSNTFGLQNLPADVTSVRGCVLVNRSRKIDGGDGNVQLGLISGASTGLGADRPITTAYTYWKDVIEVDPATGLPFTPSAFNLASLKLARTV